MTEADQLIIAVWSKGHVVPDYDASVWRRDHYGTAIRFGDYGDRDAKYGWEIDHIQRKSDRGSDHISNLRPLLRWGESISKPYLPECEFR